MPTRRDAIRLAGAVAACLSLPRRSARAADAAATIAATIGRSFVGTQGNRRELRVGDSVGVDDAVEVPAGSRLELAMNDGSRIVAAAGTRMAIVAYQTDAAGRGRDTRIRLTEGLLHNSAAPADNISSFEVSTPAGIAAARPAGGPAEAPPSDWFVEAQPNDMQVGVLSGTVTLTSAATSRTVVVPARWGARVESGRDPLHARLWTEAEFAAVIARTRMR